MMQMKEQRPDHLRENTGIASLPMEGRATSNWAVIDAGGQAVDRARGSHVTTQLAVLFGQTFERMLQVL